MSESIVDAFRNHPSFRRLTHDPCRNSGRAGDRASASPVESAGSLPVPEAMRAAGKGRTAVGQRRVRRLQRARHYRVGIAVGACVALLAGAITVSTVAIGHDEASADTWVAAAAKTKTRTAGRRRPVVWSSVRTRP